MSSHDELFANPFARAVAAGVQPPRLVVRIALIVVRVLVVICLLGAATIPFAVLIGLFYEGAKGNWWALAGAIATTVLTVLMGMGRARKKDPAAA